MAEEAQQRYRRDSWWPRMSRRMDKASLSFSEQVRDVVLLRRDLDDSFYDDLTEILVAADAGMGVAEQLVDRLRERVRDERIPDAEQALAALKQEMLELLLQRDRRLNLDALPSVLLPAALNATPNTTPLAT